MAGTGHFESNIGEDGVKRWKYNGPPIEIVEIPIVGGKFDEHSFQIGRCSLVDDYMFRIRWKSFQLH